MLKKLGQKDLELLLAEIAVEFNLLVPQQLADGTRLLSPFGEGEVAYWGAPLQRKPTSYFFPQSQQMLTIRSDGSVSLPQSPGKPLALFGLEAADLAGIAFLDRFFSAPPADDLYLQKRNGALLIGMSGYSEQDILLPVAGRNCDMEFIGAGEGWLAAGYTDSGKLLLNQFPDGSLEQLRKIEKHCRNKGDVSQLLNQASQLLRDDKVPDSFWEEIAARCILCTGCNLVCPTCSCFCIQDRQIEQATVRSRVWDSCQYDAFMREASGHNPLGTEALRTRRRIHHKLAADVERWGESGCIACGRCDRTCPTGIGMFAVVEEMIRRFGINREG